MSQARRILPATRGKLGRRIIPLSIIDASVLRFSECSAIWLFDAPDASSSSLPSLVKDLVEALGRVLDDYPHFAGQLKYVTDLNRDDPVEAVIRKSHDSRPVGRVVVCHGETTDPGVLFNVIRNDRTIDDLLSSRRTDDSVTSDWDTTDFPIGEVESPQRMAFAKLDEYLGLPGVAIQLTSFRCGGFAVNVKISHCLSDATTLCRFVNDWSRIHRGVHITLPVFQPELLDRNGRLESSSLPDPDKLRLARSLPMHRFDWYGPGPSWMTATTLATKPPDWDDIPHSPGQDMPWGTWDRNAPVERLELRFSPGRILELKSQSRASLPAEFAGVISRLDAVLAYIWSLVASARKYAEHDGAVYLNTTLGLRTRLNLPETFVGSPLMIMYTRMTGRELARASLGEIAARLRATLTRATESAVTAYIHDVTHEPSPQRLWQGFLGHDHLLFTSWMHLPMYSVRFNGSRPRYAHGVMPLLDGLLQTADDGDAMCVSIALGKSVMEKFMQNFRRDVISSREKGDDGTAHEHARGANPPNDS